MISVHWIPTHRGAEDKERFAHWKPPFVKIVCIDEKPPYTEDVPLNSMIIVRNHPMSELFGQRGLRATAERTDPDVCEAYEEYWDAFPDSRYAWGGTLKRDVNTLLMAEARTRNGFTPIWDSSVGAVVTLSPEQTGLEHAAICQRMAQYCESKGVARTRLLFEGLNEPQLWANEPPDLTARYYKAFLVGLHDYGLHGVVGNFGVGWPGNGGIENNPPQWDFFKPVIDVFQTGDYLGLHEYWALNGPGQNWLWWAGRFKQCPFTVPILITECGIDTGVAGNWYGGWYDLPGSMEQKAARYVDEIYWYAHQCAADGRVKGIFPFTYDIGGKEWEKFDIRSQVWVDTFFQKLDTEGMPQPGGDPPSPPPPPPDPIPTQYKIVGKVVGYEPNAAMSYVDGYCSMVSAEGVFMKYMGNPDDSTKRIRLRWRSNAEDAIEPMIIGQKQPGFYSISPLEPKTGEWEICCEDTFRGIQSDWIQFKTTGTQIHINFVWMPADANPNPPPMPTNEYVRDAAWMALRIPRNPDSAFYKAAKVNNLGCPVTAEMDMDGGYRWQGFSKAIVYAKVGDWDNLTIIDW